MRLIDSDRLLTDKMKSKYYHLQNGDIAIPIIDIEHAPTIEAISKADYENRLKADMVAILVELQLEIREHDPGCGWEGYADKNVIDCIIQERINSLKGE